MITFFCVFLCGNDFMPHLPSINIRNGGINILIKYYQELNKNNKNNIINIEQNYQLVSFATVVQCFVEIRDIQNGRKYQMENEIQKKAQAP